MIKNNFSKFYFKLMKIVVTLYLILCAIVYLGYLLDPRGTPAIIVMLLYWFLSIPALLLNRIGVRSIALGNFYHEHTWLSLCIYNLIFGIILSFVLSTIWCLLREHVGRK